MKIKKEHSDFTIERNEENFQVDLKNFKKEFNTDVKFYKTIKSEPSEVNIHKNSISTNNRTDSSIWNNSGFNSKIDCKKEEIKEEKCDVKHGIKSECKVVLKRLNFNVKTEDCNVVYLPDEYEDLKPVKNEFFIPDRNSNRNDTNVQIGLLSLSKNRKVSKRKPLRCDICDKIFNKRGHLERHHRTRHRVSHCCKICKKQFQTKSKLTQHQRTHSEDRPFKCNICDKGFKTNSHLRIHRESHSDQRKYSCQVCNKSFKTKCCLRGHKIVHNKDLNHSCQICNKRFKTKQCLRAHVLIHTDECKYCCQICNKYFKTKFSLRQHKKTHEDRTDKYFCDVCKTGFKCNSTFVRHRIVQHQNMFACCYCRKSFKTKNMLEAHKKIHIQKCNICKKEVLSKSSLILHQRIHSGIKPYLCKVCNRRFLSNTELKRHQSSHNKDNLPYVCEICKKGFYVKSHFLRHQPVHENKVHICIHCKGSFRTEIKLKVHLQFSCSEIHPKPLPYQCNICKRTYANSFAFEQHLLAYKDQIHFCCDVCKKKFSSKVEFQTHHKNAHPPGGIHKCEICNKIFRKRDTLNRHMKTNTDSSVKKCDVCGQKFCSFITLKRHMRGHLSE
ncbi:zinc finger protein 624-like [Centruroides vittatus]|uniref:zinc finger protein 624-like n=1 Tax=Centruroides vittatus TaxID=120091 RepID=UPI00350F705C